MAARPNRAVWGLAALAAAAAGSSAAFLGVTAWPEIVTPAYFVSRGLVLYREVFFLHSPLLICATAVLGWLLGFSGALFRVIVGVSIGATAGLLVVDAGRRRGRSAATGALLLGTPLLLGWVVYTEGPALWPDPILASMLLSGALVLERFERSGARRDLVLGFLVLGAAILVKQTAAWAGLAALAWLVARSRRRDPSTVVRAGLLLVAPCALFGLVWGLVFRTTSHLYWVFVVPLIHGRTGETAVPADLATVHEALALYLGFAALSLLALVLPAGRRLRSPVNWIAAGGTLMAWPRADLLHLAGLVGLVTLVLVRAGALVPFLARRLLKRGVSGSRLASFAVGSALVTTAVAVAALGAGPLGLDRVGRSVVFWDDSVTTRAAEDVRRHVRPGQEVLVFNARYETLYAITGTRFPGDIYVNAGFWYYLNKRGTDERVVEILRARPGLPILFREPPDDAVEARRTALYRFLTSSTVVDEVVDAGTSWRRVR